MDRFENLRFRVFSFSGALCAPLRGRQTRTPKRNTPENADSGNGPITCIFGCVAFSGVFWRLPIIARYPSEPLLLALHTSVVAKHRR